MFFDQQEFEIRCEWGEQGVAALAPISDVVIIVDVLSFSTSVDVATARGALVFPYRGPAQDAGDFAASMHAILAQAGRPKGGYSLSPSSLMQIEPGTRIVLPSPNGSTMTLAAQPAPVIAGCLRNAQAVAQAAQNLGTRIAVIPAGERWQDRQSLRPSFEDLVGAGAIISFLNGSRSPEADSAVAAFQMAQPRLVEHLCRCSSGKELTERGFIEDVKIASKFDISLVAPVFVAGGFFRAG